MTARVQKKVKQMTDQTMEATYKHRGKIATGGTLLVITTFLQLLIPGGIPSLVEKIGVRQAEAVTMPQVEEVITRRTSGYVTRADVDSMMVRRDAVMHQRFDGVEKQLTTMNDYLKMLIEDKIKGGAK
jgi:hypothetical protein